MGGFLTALISFVPFTGFGADGLDEALEVLFRVEGRKEPILETEGLVRGTSGLLGAEGLTVEVREVAEGNEVFAVLEAVVVGCFTVVGKDLLVTEGFDSFETEVFS